MEACLLSIERLHRAPRRVARRCRRELARVRVVEAEDRATEVERDIRLLAVLPAGELAVRAVRAAIQLAVIRRDRGRDPQAVEDDAHGHIAPAAGAGADGLRMVDREGAAEVLLTRDEGCD